MNKERKIILEMMKNGTITLEEAEELLDAAENSHNNAGAAEVKRQDVKPKRIRVAVEENGKQIVNIKLPFGLIRTGLNIAQKIGPKYAKEAEVLNDINVDEILAGLSSGEITLPYTIVDVNDGGDHVEISLE